MFLPRLSPLPWQATPDGETFPSPYKVGTQKTPGIKGLCQPLSHPICQTTPIMRTKNRRDADMPWASNRASLGSLWGWRTVLGSLKFGLQTLKGRSITPVQTSDS